MKKLYSEQKIQMEELEKSRDSVFHQEGKLRGMHMCINDSL